MRNNDHIDTRSKTITAYAELHMRNYICGITYAELHMRNYICGITYAELHMHMQLSILCTTLDHCSSEKFWAFFDNLGLF